MALSAPEAKKATPGSKESKGFKAISAPPDLKVCCLRSFLQWRLAYHEGATLDHTLLCLLATLPPLLSHNNIAGPPGTQLPDGTSAGEILVWQTPPGVWAPQVGYVAIGSGTSGWNTGSVAIGPGAGGDGAAVGQRSYAGFSSAALGRDAQATGTQSIAIGGNAQAASDSIAIGPASKSTGSSSISIGGTASGNNAQNIVIGNMARATGQRSIALGHSATSSTGSIAIGIDLAVAGSNSVAIGNNLMITASNTIVLSAAQAGDIFPVTDGGFYVKPIRGRGAAAALSYDSGTGEVVYNPSSARYKKNVAALDAAEAALLHKLRPVR